jgi:DeoR/GlpR family transcriptional regulator of sugar metabolism
MTSEARQQEILRRVLGQRQVRVKELAAEYGVHEMTIRRDLDLLADSGHILRIHGGARLGERTSEELSYQLRSTQNQGAKESIARAALGLIEEGDTIALDASTTSLALARMLGGRDVRAIVTGLDAAEALAAVGIPFVLAGGAFHPPARSFVGAFVKSTLERLNADKAFFSAKGYTSESGFSDPHLPEVEVKAALLRGGGTVVALLDAPKFGRRSLARIASTDEVDVVVTDCHLGQTYEEEFSRQDVRLIVAE